jgi:hypothetical protein
MLISTRSLMACSCEQAMLCTDDRVEKGRRMINAHIRRGKYRERLVLAGVAGILSMLLVSAAALIVFLWQPDDRPRLGHLSDLAVGQVRLRQLMLPSARVNAEATATATWVYLVRPSTTDVLALSQRDPRNGCRLVWEPATRVFIDPCHGSTYTLTGEYVRGPSMRGLDRFPVQVSHNDQIVIRTLTPVPGAAARR